MASRATSGDDLVDGLLQPSLPGRDSDADADISMERKRPRLSDDEQSTASGSHDHDSVAVTPPSSPQIELVINNDGPSESLAGLVTAKPGDTTTSSLGDFPFQNDEFPTPESVAVSLTHSFRNDKTIGLSDLQDFQRWMIQYARNMTPEHRHVQDADFWNAIGHCVSSLLRRSSFGPKFQGSARMIREIMESLTRAMAAITAVLIRVETANIERAARRRDSVGQAAEVPSYQMVFYPCIEAFVSSIKPVIPLYRFLHKAGQLDDHSLQADTAQVFVSQTENLGDLKDLFTIVFNNRSQIDRAYTHLVTYLQVIYLTISSTSDEVTTSKIFDQAASMLETSASVLLPDLVSLNPNKAPGVADFMLSTIEALATWLTTIKSSFGMALFDHSLAACTNSNSDDLNLFRPNSGLEIDSGKLRLLRDQDQAQMHLFGAIFCKMDMAIILLQSEFTQYRLIGMHMLQGIFQHALQPATPADQPFDPGHPLLQAVTQYITQRGMIDMIFRSSHDSAVIERSIQCLVFIHTTGHYSTTDTDKIWYMITHQSQTDCARASLKVLSYLMSKELNEPDILYILSKIETLPTPLEKKFLLPLQGLSRRLHFVGKNSRCPDMFRELSLKFTALLRRFGMTHGTEDLRNAHEVIMECLETATQYLDEIGWRSIVRACSQSVSSASPQATANFTTLLLLFRRNSQAVWLFSSMTSLEETISDLEVFAASQRSQDVTRIDVYGLCTRIDLALHHLNGTRELDRTGAYTRIWDLITGQKSVNAQCRQMGLNILGHHLQHTSLEKFRDLCVFEYLTSLPIACASNGLLGFYESVCLSQKGQEGFTKINDHCLVQLTRFALEIPDVKMASCFEDRIIGALFHVKKEQPSQPIVQAQCLVVDRCLDAIHSDTSLADRALGFLFRLHQQASASQAQFGSSQSSSELGTISIDGENDSESDGKKVLLRVEATDLTMAKRKFTLVGDSCSTLGQLEASLRRHTAFSKVRIFWRGKEVKFESSSDVTLSAAGITEDSVLQLRKVATAESLLSDQTLSQGRTEVEKRLMQSYGAFVDLLNHGNHTSRMSCELLQKLPISVSQRSLAYSQIQNGFENLEFGDAWKTEFFVYVLHSILIHQTNHGIAEATFISRCVQYLVKLLPRISIPVDVHPLKIVISALQSFLAEHPVNSLSSTYFVNADIFIRSILDILRSLPKITSETSEIITLSIGESAFGCLLEALILSDSVRIALFRENAGAGKPYKDQVGAIFSTQDSRLVTRMAQRITVMCENAALAPDVITWFWTVFLDLLPYAAKTPGISDPVFSFAPAIFRAHQVASTVNDGPRAVLDIATTLLWTIESNEPFNSTTFDPRIRGLCELINHCIVLLKSLKKPLGLGSLARRLYERLLFPEIRTDPAQTQPHSVKNENTRKLIYDMILSVCEDRATLAQLTELASKTNAWAQDAHFEDSQYCSRVKYLRQVGGHTGLVNLGQTCYLNSLLQQLFMNIDFRRFILETRVTNESEQAVLLALQRLFAILHGGHIRHCIPEDMANVLGIDVSVQEDAPLFFTMLIGRLEDSMPDSEAKKTLQSFFGGRNRSQTKGECGHVSESTDDYFNLSLTVKDKANLIESLQEYVAGAPLEGGDKFKCLTCEEQGKPAYVNALRRTGLESIPNTLVFGLKRFRYETMDGGTKVNDRFDFPARLDMAPFKLQNLAGVDGNSETDMFELTGVVVHQGTLQFGHYWSYAKDYESYGQQPGKWFRMEDSMVEATNQDFVLQECRGGLTTWPNGFISDRADSAYILLYRRIQTPPNDNEAGQSLKAQENSVAITKAAQETIEAANLEVMKLVHTLDPAHLSFLRRLLHWINISSNMDDNPSSEQERQVIDVALSHLQLLNFAKADSDQLQPFQTTFEAVVLRSTSHCIHVIHWLLDEIGWISLFFSGNAIMRSFKNHLILACLRKIKDQDPMAYARENNFSTPDAYGDRNRETLLEKVIASHRHALSKIHEYRSCWVTYFDLIAQISALGVEETAAVLEKGYLRWCLTAICIPFSNTHPGDQHHGLFNLIKNEKIRPPLVFLADAIYGILKQHIYLAGFGQDELTPIDNPRIIVDGMCRINPAEAWELLYTIRNGGLRLIYAVGELPDSTNHFKVNRANWPLTRLTTMLLGQDLQREMREELIQGLMYGVETSTDHVHNFAAAATAACHVDIEHRYRIFMLDSFIEMAKRGDGTDHMLTFTENIMPVMAMDVLKSVDTWVSKLLDPEDPFIANMVLTWLMKVILWKPIFHSPSSSHQIEVDLARLTSVAKMHKMLSRDAQSAIAKLEPWKKARALLMAFQGCQLYLERFCDLAVKGSKDTLSIMNEIFDDDDVARIDTSDLDNPLIQFGGTIDLSMGVMNMPTQLAPQISAGKHLVANIERYQLEEEELESIVEDDDVCMAGEESEDEYEDEDD